MEPFCKTGFCETGFCETGFCETGFCETGFGETGFGETGRNRQDTQLYISFTPTNSALSLETLTTTFNDILSWMNLNKLLLNPSKTQFLLTCTKQQRLKFFDLTNLSLSNDIIPVSSSACLASSLTLTCLSLIKSTLYPNFVIFISETSVKFIIFFLLQPQLLQIHLSLANLTTSIYFTLASHKLISTSLHSKFIGTCHYKHFKISTHHINTRKTTLASYQTKNRLQNLSSHIQNTYKSTTYISQTQCPQN